MCLNLKTKPYWHHNDRRGLTVGDALCASVSGTGCDWRSDLDVFGIETGVIKVSNWVQSVMPGQTPDGESYTDVDWAEIAFSWNDV